MALWFYGFSYGLFGASTLTVLSTLDLCTTSLYGASRLLFMVFLHVHGFSCLSRYLGSRLGDPMAHCFAPLLLLLAITGRRIMIPAVIQSHFKFHFVVRLAEIKRSVTSAQCVRYDHVL